MSGESEPQERGGWRSLRGLDAGEADERLVAFLKGWSRAAAAIVIAVPCAVLAGWLLENESLKRVLPGLVAMNPLTAILFILLGSGLALTSRGATPNRVAQALGAFVAMIGTLVLGRYVFGWEISLDRWLFATALEGNVMAPTTAFNFVLSGAALTLSVSSKPRLLLAAQLCAIIAAVCSLLAFTGYMYGIERLYRLATFIAMAVHTATNFLVFATGLLALHPEHGLMARCTSARAGGVMLRRLLLPTLLIPPFLGWLVLIGHRAGWWEPALGFTLLVMAMVLFVGVLVWRNAQGLDREDAARLESDARLREAHAGLERNIAERTVDLHQAIAGVREGLQVLALSTEEILDASSHLAASANDAASAAAETTATVEEVRQTTQLATRGAQRVAECARAAAEVSGAGTSATRATADGMEHVRGEMSLISKRMSELSAQTQAIGAIIAAVDQIATQSNLLSVNAAIEAARAGEKGRGFAVVADEVRFLSNQSRDATRQVRGILGDIQKATSAAVMTTDQAAAAVESGATQAAHAGESIVGLEARVAEAAQVAGEIANSSHEQALGMEHVAAAMDRIKGTTRDNLREAKRLEEAARRLHTLGQQLKELAERHRG